MAFKHKHTSLWGSVLWAELGVKSTQKNVQTHGTKSVALGQWTSASFKLIWNKLIITVCTCKYWVLWATWLLVQTSGNNKDEQGVFLHNFSFWLLLPKLIPGFKTFFISLLRRLRRTLKYVTWLDRSGVNWDTPSLWGNTVHLRGYLRKCSLPKVWFLKSTAWTGNLDSPPTHLHS